MTECTQFCNPLKYTAVKVIHFRCQGLSRLVGSPDPQACGLENISTISQVLQTTEHLSLRSPWQNVSADAVGSQEYPNRTECDAWGLEEPEGELAVLSEGGGGLQEATIDQSLEPWKSHKYNLSLTCCLGTRRWRYQPRLTVRTRIKQTCFKLTCSAHHLNVIHLFFPSLSVAYLSAPVLSNRDTNGLYVTTDHFRRLLLKGQLWWHASSWHRS